MAMTAITVVVPDELDAVLVERMQAFGIRSKEEYLLSLVEADCAANELERILDDRMKGPFAPLAPDWMEQVRRIAKAKYLEPEASGKLAGRRKPPERE
jgi:hypothetical protein